MPLIPGKGKKAFKENLHELYVSNPSRPVKQDLAIAYKEQRKGKKVR